MGCGGSKTAALPKATAPLTLYVWPGSAPCRAVLMTARAANIDVAIVNVNVMQGEQKSDDFSRLNPDGTVPVLVDKKAKKEIPNSHAIMPYLLDIYSPDNLLYPSDPSRRTAIDRALKYDQEKIYPAITNWVYPQIFKDEPANDDLFKAVKEVLDELDKSLSETPYLACKKLSIADLATVANLSLLKLVYYELTPWKNISAWLVRIEGLPYYASCNIGLQKWITALYVKEQDKRDRERSKAARKAEE